MPKSRKPKAAAGHQLADKLPVGFGLIDLRKKKWVVGQPIGSGGFGLIYMAEEEGKSPDDKSRFVIKVEPHSNGPLFSEIAFYQRAATKDCINTWIKKRKVPYVGVPAYIAHGIHELAPNNKLRFMVMPRFGMDLHNVWMSANKTFKRETVAGLAIKLITSLQYMHENEYVHADIKGANILLGHKDNDKVFLVDFGLAFRYVANGNHKAYKEEPKKAHDGTIEYTSIDAHLGVCPARRSDMEILGYVLVHWVCGTLPWEKDIANKNLVRDKKIEAKKNVKKFISNTCNLPELQNYMEYVKNLEYDEEPDYDKMRRMFEDVLKKTKSRKSKLDFGTATKSSRKSQSQSEVEAVSESDAEPVKAKPKRSTKGKVSAAGKPSNAKSEPKPPIKRASKSTVKKTTKKQTKTSTEEEEVTISEEEDLPQQTKRLVRSNPQRTSRKRTKVSAEEEECPLISEDEEEEKPPRKSRTKRSAQKKKTVYLISSDEESEEEVIPSPKQQIKKTSRKTTRASKSSQDEKTSSNSQSAPSDVAGSSASIAEETNEEEEPPMNTSNKENTLNEEEFFDSVSPQENSASENDCKSTKEVLKMKRSRYSMAPLHTAPVLGKGDKLSGRTIGKHKEILRKKRKNAVMSDAVTQTTPSLRRGKVKSRI